MNRAPIAPPPTQYTIDWEKVTSFKELRVVMTALEFAFTEKYKNFEALKPFAKPVQ